MKKVALITGASAGIGKATAKLLAQKGYIVYGAARRTEKMKDLEPFGIRPLEMDVTSDGSMLKAIEKITGAEKRIDVLVNSAGFGSHGAIEDVPMSDARYQLEVNVIGLARLTQLVLPHMRKQKSGKIVNISSIGGKFAGPFGGWYHASKFALEGLSDSLRNEVKPFGIDVIIIEPGSIKTEWSDIAANNMLKTSGSATSVYKNGVDAYLEMVNQSAAKRSEPQVIADVICKAIESRHPKVRYVAGHMAKSAIFMQKILPDKIMDKMVMNMIKPKK